MDAYQVLGVRPNAAPDEINKAYKSKLAILSESNLSDAEMQEKTDELNLAYDSLMYDGNTSYNTSSQGNATRYADVRAKINEGRTEDAETILDGVPIDIRNAEWYFLKGTILHKRGWYEGASENYAKAVQLEPNNPEYLNAWNEINNNRKGAFRQDERGADIDPCGGLCSTCATLACCDCLCSSCR